MDTNEPKKSKRARPYSPPRVEDFGTVAEITKTMPRTNTGSEDLCLYGDRDICGYL